MKRFTRCALALLGAALLVATVGAQAQTYPDKPVTIIVPYPAGGVMDLTARALADGLTDACVAVLVEQRREEAKRDPEWIAKQMGKVQRAITTLDEDSLARLRGEKIGFVEFKHPRGSFVDRVIGSYLRERVSETLKLSSLDGMQALDSNTHLVNQAFFLQPMERDVAYPKRDLDPRPGNGPLGSKIGLPFGF